MCKDNYDMTVRFILPSWSDHRHFLLISFVNGLIGALATLLTPVLYPA